MNKTDSFRGFSMLNRYSSLCLVKSPSMGCAVLSRSVVSDSAIPWTCSPPGSFVCGDSSGKNTGVVCHALLQEIFPNQGSKLHLLCLLHIGELFTH